MQLRAAGRKAKNMAEMLRTLRHSYSMVTKLRIGCALSAVFAAAIVAPSRAADALPSSAAEMYRLTNVWSIHLKFDPAEWQAMEPKGGGGFPPFGGGRGPGGPGGGPGRFGPPPPSVILAPPLLRDGDDNRDGKLSQDEFTKVGAKWFEAWDKDKAGKLNNEQIVTGINSLMGPPGPGAFGPPGGRGGGMNLQGPEGGRNGIAARMGWEFTYVRGAIQFEGATFSNVAVRYKGNGTFLGSRNAEKKSLKVDLNKFVKGQKLADVATINLHNAITDASYMNEALAYKLHRDARVPAPRTAYARVNISNGSEHKNEYFGLYVMVENVDDEFTKETFQTKGGALFKPVTPSLFEDLGDDWEKYTQTYDPKDKPSKKEIARVLEMCRLVSKASDEDFAAKLGDYIDIDAFARYMAVTVYLSDLDGILGPGQNFYLYLHPQTQKFHWIAWDQDHSFGQMRGSQEDREQLSVHRPWTGENRFLERVFKVEAFKKAYLERMREFSGTIFKSDRFHKQVDELAPQIRPAVKQESGDKLERFEMAISGKQPEGGDFGFMRGGSKPVKGFVVPRSQSIAEQLAGKSEGNTLGFGGFGPGGGRGRGGFGPGNFLAEPLLRKLDANADKEVTQGEFNEGFTKMFAGWNKDKVDGLNEEQIRAGIDQEFGPRGAPFRQ
jgi:spore coat protein CotH